MRLKDLVTPEGVPYCEIKDLMNITVFPLAPGVRNSVLLRNIHPIMQGNIQRVLDMLKEYNTNEVKVILFGSSITMHCNERSDIDVAIVTRGYNEDLFREIWHKIKSCVDCNVDALYYNELKNSSRIYQEVINSCLLLEEDYYV